MKIKLFNKGKAKIKISMTAFIRKNKTKIILIMPIKWGEDLLKMYEKYDAELQNNDDLETKF